jgi:hypothetical protein
MISRPCSYVASPMTSEPTVRDLLLGQQANLMTRLGVASDLHSHPTDLGDASELHWIEALREFLPGRYHVEKARVLDSRGEISLQIDAIIFDRHYCPLWFHDSGSHYVPAESVYAALEVKQDFSKEHLKEASDKVESVRRLHRTNGPFPTANGLVENRGEPFSILGGILATRSSWTSGLGDPFESALLGEPDQRRLDLGCALADGAFEMSVGDDGPRVRKSAPDAALIFLLLRLFERLQALGTVPAIELEEYSRSVDEGAPS